MHVDVCIPLGLMHVKWSETNTCRVGCVLAVVLQIMKPSSNPPPIVAVDAPSGWHVENGDESGQPAQLLLLITSHKQNGMKTCADVHIPGA